MSIYVLTDWLLGTMFQSAMVAIAWALVILVWFMVYDFIRREWNGNR